MYKQVLCKVHSGPIAGLNDFGDQIGLKLPLNSLDRKKYSLLLKDYLQSQLYNYLH